MNCRLFFLSCTVLVHFLKLESTTSGQAFFLVHNGSLPANGLLERANVAHENVEKKAYGYLSAATFFSESINKKELGEALFFNGKNAMKFGPAKTASNDTDVFSLNFLLDESFEGTARIEPRVTTIATQIGSFVGLDNFLSGLWVCASVPFVHTRWDLNLTSTAQSENGAAFDNHAFINGINQGSPYSSIEQAWKGDKIPSDGLYTETWLYGKVYGMQSQTALGDAKIAIGYDLLHTQKGYVSVGFLGLLNGSTVSKAEYFFEPLIGTAGRYGIGTRFDGHFRIKTPHEKCANFFVRADFVHLFSKTMRRSYDYTDNGKGSRYLLIRKHAAYNALADSGGILNSVNLTSLRSKIGIDLMWDVHTLLQWEWRKYGLHAGYGLSGNTKEKHEEWVDRITPAMYTFYAAGNANAEGVGGSTGAVKLYPQVTINGAQGSAGIPMVDATDLATAAITEELLNKSSGLHPRTIYHHFFAGLLYSFESHTKKPFISFSGGFEFSDSHKGLFQWDVALSGGINL